VRIGIIGGGAAGLTSAWLLQDSHEVTVLEQQARLGGHAHTVQVDDLGTRIAVEAGFEFFSRAMWPTFNRLLAELGVPLRDYRTRIAVYRMGHPTTRVLQPMHIDGRFAPSLLGPRTALDLAQFALVLASVAPLMRAHDTSVTIEQALSRVPLTRSFRDEFLWPFLLSGWCVQPDEFRGFAAYNVLRYSYLGVTPRGAIAMQEVVGGMHSYVAAMQRQMPRVTWQTSSEIESVERTADATFTVRQRDGRIHAFDQLIVATNASDAAKLLRCVRGAEKVQALLGRYEYVQTKIAVHGDRRVMPAREQDWSIVNVRHDGKHAHTTVWKPWRSQRVFRSWITYDESPPQHVHEIVTFDHPKATCEYFELQRALIAQQGDGGLWLAGMHMHDVDSHESAVRSAVNVVQRLDPNAPRLPRLA
jgi:predicted NAD/FAD-binding protein